GGYMDADGNLRPDRTYEGEGGLDLAIAPADGRLSLTAYRRRESHRRPYLVGYTGFLVPLPAVRRVVNGLELDGRIVPVATSAVRLETKLGFTLQADRVRSETSGPLGLIVDQYDFLSRLSMLQGRSFSSWISTPYTYADTNRDGRLDVLTGAAPSVVGRSRPSRFGTLDTRLTLAQHWTLAANLGYAGGHKVLDKVESIRCRVRICAAAQGASLADQAHVQMMGGPEYFVPGDALRVHELSLAYGAPGLARLTRAGGVRVTIAARNLATFSHARYLDPETELPLPGIEGDVVQDPGLALQRTLVIRLTATY
ncbi:MAG TPA: hypothetical protein VHM30_13510, partial [Gemmatimonadaceae bacterium]|nr:hypothetical protein [Gemmatimonadaceae bacterium]